MASRHSIKNRGFTLIEMAVAILIFIIGAYLISVSYLNVVKGYINTQNLQISLSNLRLSLDKIWKDMKYGVGFSTTTNCISFKRIFDCKDESVCLDGNKLKANITGNESVLTDEEVLEINSFNIDMKGIINPSDPNYILSSPKLITIGISGNLILPNKRKSPFNIQMSVAPINSVFPQPKCIAQPTP
jgi:prepilin-type N-terminal cleavage/methylation domain-containing protein